MEHFIGIAVWITLLTLSGCLQTKSQPIGNFGHHFLRKHVKCLSDSKFYAPENVEPQCITTALDCVRRELNGTVKEECGDPMEYIGLDVQYLDRLITERSEKGHALTNSTECKCERWSETPFHEFLDKTVTLLEKSEAQLS